MTPAAQRRVDREAARRFHRLAEFELEQEIGEGHGLAQIGEHVAQAGSDRLRGRAFIGMGDRRHDRVVHRLS